MENVKGFEMIKGTPRCVCCNTFVSKKNIQQLPQQLFPMMENDFEFGICPKCAGNKSVEEIKTVLETKHGRKMPAPVPKNVIKINRAHKNINNSDMIKFVKDAVDSEDLGGILSLKEMNPETFETSLKYIGTKRIVKLQEMIEAGKLSATTEDLKDVSLNVNEAANILKIAIDTNDVEKINVIREFHKEIFETSLKYLGSRRNVILQQII